MRNAQIAVLLFACACNRYWVESADLVQARTTNAPTVAAIREDDASMTIPMNQLLVISEKPREDGRVPVADVSPGRRTQQKLLLGFGVPLVHIGIVLVGIGAAFTANGHCTQSYPVTFQNWCIDLGLNYVGPMLLGIGVPTTVIGLALTVAGARIKLAPKQRRQ